jgi:hypothetical protein
MGARGETIPMGSNHPISQDERERSWSENPSRDASECPPPDALVDFGLNDCREKVRLWITNHVGNIDDDPKCPRCALVLRAMRSAIQKVFGPTGEEAPDAGEVEEAPDPGEV